MAGKPLPSCLQSRYPLSPWREWGCPAVALCVCVQTQGECQASAACLWGNHTIAGWWASLKRSAAPPETRFWVRAPEPQQPMSLLPPLLQPLFQFAELMKEISLTLQYLPLWLWLWGRGRKLESQRFLRKYIGKQFWVSFDWLSNPWWFVWFWAKPKRNILYVSFQFFKNKHAFSCSFCNQAVQHVCFPHSVLQPHLAKLISDRTGWGKLSNQTLKLTFKSWNCFQNFKKVGEGFHSCFHPLTRLEKWRLATIHTIRPAMKNFACYPQRLVLTRAGNLPLPSAHTVCFIVMLSFLKKGFCLGLSLEVFDLKPCSGAVVHSCSWSLLLYKHLVCCACMWRRARVPNSVVFHQLKPLSSRVSHSYLLLAALKH